MKKKLYLVLLLLCVKVVNGQLKTIENITKFKVKNSGAFLDENNSADGYYFFYQVDKLKKGKREYAINFLDQNLNDIATKKMIASKRVQLIASGFNNEVSMFVFLDAKEKTFTLKSFDKKANAREDVVITLTNKQAKTVNTFYKTGMFQNVLIPIKNKGFLIVLTNHDGKGMGYTLKFLPTDSNLSEWEYKFTPSKENKGNYGVIPVALNKNFIVLNEIKSKLFSSKREYKTVVLNSNNGNKLFEKPYDKADPKLISNSFISKEENVTVLGQYYKPKAKLGKAQSLGLFVDVLDTKGNIVFNKKISWKEDVGKFLPVKDNNKLKGIGFIYFHDIIKTENGDYYAIGEQYKKTVSAIGVAGALLGGGNSVTQLTIKDVYIFKFDKDFNLEDVKTFEKGISRVQNLYDYGSPQFSAFMIKAIGGFDYVNSQLDKRRDRFYANFIDYERGDKNSKSQLVFKTIIHSDGELSEDKVVLPTKRKYFRVLPGKLGHVLILEYDRKKKTTTLHIEKLNIK
ncbi:hypothetical protein H3Z83_04010 [Tenacibaculum sp. S7007]|uniref:Uncharacterized protein n=1 Tax=Tenacibaculum pelagium TaxID=2759527 RepID=A0A839AMR8_9FLAO|nr:DUF6770 family protein [Tenacibaculum pelagium]MBA6155688.1 hypothetical protein [Tenacibaculum pelagium]